jgi:nitrogen fixation/metabolism regulation signal transduction histidine kinase
MFDLLLVVATAVVTLVIARAFFVRRAASASGERERLSLEILGPVVDSAPTAIVVYRDAGHIAYANDAARALFFEGESWTGKNLLTLLNQAPPPFRNALLGGSDDLFTVEEEGERETYHLAKRTFDSKGERYTVIMVKHLTQELNRQEVAIWKKLIRTISHELNNSLAPVSSLVHSARILVKGSPEEQKLTRVFDTVAERMSHLKEFLEGYAQFARMPAPQKRDVRWSELLDPIRELYPAVRVVRAPEGSGHFDPAQIQQVLINLIKNAEEAGSPQDTIELDVTADAGEATILVSDRGSGMSEEVLRSALLPFYSTKQRGTGLGLALSREIVDAHGGRLRLQSREGGGVVVSCTLPRAEKRVIHSQARLTLTRSIG